MNYRNIKLLFLPFLIIISIFISCKNEDSIVVNLENTEQSNAAKIAISSLKTHFNTDGSLNTDENFIENIIFDFGFEFIYPNTLLYNNGAEIIVENFENLVNIIINTTDSLFIDGISFPFQVKTFDNGAIQINTINNESEFVTLLENRRITGDDCVCSEESDPVCVEIPNSNGDIFTMQFPNMCYATCEGFTQSDIVVCTYENPANVSFNDCFDFVYPFSIINSDDNTIIINNIQDFENALFLNYMFDFVYPFDIIIGDNERIETILNEEELINLLINCYTSNCWDNCPTTGSPVCAEFEQDGQTIVFGYQNSCYAECDGFTAANYVNCTDNANCYNSCSGIYDPVCVEVTLPNGLTVNYIYQNSCFAECEGFTPANFIACD